MSHVKCDNNWKTEVTVVNMGIGENPIQIFASKLLYNTHTRYYEFIRPESITVEVRYSQHMKQQVGYRSVETERHAGFRQIRKRIRCLVGSAPLHGALWIELV